MRSLKASPVRKTADCLTKKCINFSFFVMLKRKDKNMKYQKSYCEKEKSGVYCKGERKQKIFSSHTKRKTQFETETRLDGCRGYLARIGSRLFLNVFAEDLQKVKARSSASILKTNDCPNGGIMPIRGLFCFFISQNLVCRGSRRACSQHAAQADEAYT